MKYISLLLLLLASNLPAQSQPSARISGPENYIPQPFDVLHYDAVIDLTKAPEREMSGVCDITLRWVGDPASGPFYFHLRDLTISQSFYNGNPVTAIAEESPSSATFHYRIDPPSGVKQGDTATIRIVYSGSMTDEGGAAWGGVSTAAADSLIYAMGVGFNNNYVSATQHWLPCYDHPSDKATFHGRFLVNKELTVASNGTLQIEAQKDGKAIYNWTHDIPCATYLYTFAVGPYFPLQFSTGTLPMVVYSLAGDTAATRISFKLLPRMVETLSRRFGAYPFEKVGYVNTPKGSMEHETMVSFAASISRSRDSANPTAAHELAHQWFGDLVSPQDFRDAWLNESFAVFCESIWAEELGGYAGYLRSQENERVRYINSTAKTEGVFPLYDFPRTPPSSNYPATIYGKGAVVVGMLRYELGDSIFFSGMQDYLRKYSYSVATTDSLRAVLESHAGRSLKWFFDQWVIGKGWPVLDIQSSKQPIGDALNRVTVQLAQKQSQDYGIFTNVPVEIGFKSSGGITTYRMARLTAQTEGFVFDSIPDFISLTMNQGPSVRALIALGKISGVAVGSALPDSGDIQFVVRPNPAANVAAISVSVLGTKECAGLRYELYDTSGTRMLLGNTDSCEFPIPTAGFSSGVYVLRFKLRNNYYDVPVVIAH